MCIYHKQCKWCPSKDNSDSFLLFFMDFWPISTNSVSHERIDTLLHHCWNSFCWEILHINKIWWPESINIYFINKLRLFLFLSIFHIQRSIDSQNSNFVINFNIAFIARFQWFCTTFPRQCHWRVVLFVR